MKLQFATILVWIAVIIINIANLFVVRSVHRSYERANRLNEDTLRIVRETEVIQERNRIRMQRILEAIQGTSETANNGE